MATVEDPLDLVAELADELLRLTRRRRSVYVESELDNSAFHILWVLADGSARTLRELADELMLEQSTVNRQVNAAIKAGLLERFEVAGSASKRVRPTTEGAAAYARDGRLRGTVIRSVLDELGADRSRSLLADLRELNDAWDRALDRDQHGRARP